MAVAGVLVCTSDFCKLPPSNLHGIIHRGKIIKIFWQHKEIPVGWFVLAYISNGI